MNIFEIFIRFLDELVEGCQLSKGVLIYVFFLSRRRRGARVVMLLLLLLVAVVVAVAVVGVGGLEEGANDPPRRPCGTSCALVPCV